MSDDYNASLVELSVGPRLNAQHALRRAWRHVTPSSVPWKKYKNKLDFSVVSYNILSQRLLENNRYLYRTIKDSYLQADRADRVINELELYEPDIVCLQEFDHQIRDKFNAHFGPKGYKNTYQRKPFVPYQEKDDGCFMMYKADKFRLVKDASIGLYKNGEKLLDKPNCAQIVLFQCPDGSQMCVANTHLLYNPRRGDIKLAQLSLIINSIQNLINPTQKCGGIPVIFCGDFNTCPNAPLYELMKRGKLQYSDYATDKISGQKISSKKFYNISPGLWNDVDMGYHEHGLVKQNDEHLNKCSETNRCLEQGSGLLSTEYRNLEKCYKCGELYPYKPGRISHNLNFRSAYDHIDSDGRTREVTTYIQNDARTVDYIWYTNHDNTAQNCPHGHSCQDDCSAPLLLLQSRRRLLTKPELASMERLPNELLGSDHQALQARFVLYSHADSKKRLNSSNSNSSTNSPTNRPNSPIKSNSTMHPNSSTNRPNSSKKSLRGRGRPNSSNSSTNIPTSSSSINRPNSPTNRPNSPIKSNSTMHPNSSINRPNSSKKSSRGRGRPNSSTNIPTCSSRKRERSISNSSKSNNHPNSSSLENASTTDTISYPTSHLYLDRK